LDVVCNPYNFKRAGFDGSDHVHGVATANSILVVSFARERMNAGLDAFKASMEAGFTRFARS